MFVYETLQKAIDDTFSKQLLFIIGVAKSGTTWLQLTLDGHPEIACRGEGHFTNYLAPNLKTAADRYNQLIDGKNKTIFTEIEGFPLLRRDHVLFLLASAIGLQMAEYGKGNLIRVIGEKTPDNVHALPALHELFPDAKFIHIIRDGRDAAVSAWFHNFRVAPDLARKTLGTLPRFAEKSARAWVRAVKAGRAFGTQHPRQYLEVRYEDLRQDTAGSVLRALEFLGVDASDHAITRCLDAGSFETYAGGRKPGEEDRKSLFRKGGVGDWRNHFDSRATETYERHAGDLLRQLGYS